MCSVIFSIASWADLIILMDMISIGFFKQCKKIIASKEKCKCERKQNWMSEKVEHFHRRSNIHITCWNSKVNVVIGETPQTYIRNAALAWFSSHCQSLTDTNFRRRDHQNRINFKINHHYIVFTAHHRCPSFVCKLTTVFFRHTHKR